MTTTTTTSPAGIGHNAPPLGEVLADRTLALRQEVDALAAKANTWPKTEAGALAKIGDESGLAVASDLVKSARVIAKRADDVRKIEKEPHLSACREVDGFFGAIIARLERIGVAFHALADDFTRTKADEERKRREEEARRLREEEERARAAAEAARRPATAAKREAEAEAAADRAADAEAFAAAPVADLIAPTVSASGVKAAAKTEWIGEVTDLGKLDLEPLRYLLKRDAIDAAVKLYVKNGGRSLAGARIVEEVRASIR